MTIIKFLAIISLAIALTACTGKADDGAAQPTTDAAAPAAPADAGDAGAEAAPADDAAAPEGDSAEGETAPE